MAGARLDDRMNDMKLLISTLTSVLARGLCVTLLAFQLAWAADPFSVRDIRVEGLQRVEPGTVFATLPFRVGDAYTDERGVDAIRALFGLGLFNNVRIETDGDVVVVVVEERPIIGTLDLIGTKEFDKDTLRKALRDIGLSEGRPFDKAMADKAEQELNANTSTAASTPQRSSPPSPRLSATGSTSASM